MIVWINGTFGVGKTTTTQLLVERGRNLRAFDPEWVGYMLSANLKDLGVADFQDLTPWRRLVPHVMSEVQTLTGSDLVAPQTVLIEAYWNELKEGMAALGLDSFHIVLDCNEEVLRNRIENDELEADARQWRLDHLDRYRESAAWMRQAADLVIDTTDLAPTEVASVAVAAVAS